MMIKFTAELEPVPYKRPRFNGKHVFNDRRYTDYKDVVGFIAKRAMRLQGVTPLKGNVQITIKVFRDLKPSALHYGDWDNHGKAICDALNGICYNDDRQVIIGHVYLLKGKPSRIEVELQEAIMDGGTLPLTTENVTQDFRDFLQSPPAVELMRAASSPDNEQAKVAAHKFADAFIKYMEAQNE